MLEIIHEHNLLNGFRFVLVEFIVVTAIASFVGGAGILRGNFVYAFFGFGIAANAIYVCTRVIQQLRRGEKDIGLYEVYFGPNKKLISEKYPDLSLHTAQLSVALLMPFLVPILALWPRRMG